MRTNLGGSGMVNAQQAGYTYGIHGATPVTVSRIHRRLLREDTRVRLVAIHAAGDEIKLVQYQ
jgi:hypothetical protein